MSNPTSSKTIAKGILRALLIVTGAVLLLLFLWQVQSVLLYIAIAAVLSLVARPIIHFLKKILRFPNTLAVITTMLLFIFLLYQLVRLFIPLVLKQSENLALLNSNAFKGNVEAMVTEIQAYFSNRGINLFKEFEKLDLLSYFSEIPSLLNAVLASVGSISIAIFSVLFIAFFLMKDQRILQGALLTLAPTSSEERLQKSLHAIKRLLSRYFIGLIFQITIVFTIYTSALIWLGVENAVVIGFLCALLNLIPYVGPIIGGILMFVLTITSNLGQDFQTEILPTTLYAMLWYAIAQLVDNFFSQPVIFSKSAKSHPLEIFLVIIIFGLLFGPLGMIIAVPSYTSLKVILKEFLAENKIVKSLTKDL